MNIKTTPMPCLDSVHYPLSPAGEEPLDQYGMFPHLLKGCIAGLWKSNPNILDKKLGRKKAEKTSAITPVNFGPVEAANLVAQAYVAGTLSMREEILNSASYSYGILPYLLKDYVVWLGKTNPSIFKNQHNPEGVVPW